jgi:mevalonate kinase
MTTSTAPGKIILFGEHAVVYGQPALAVPVTQVQATVTVRESDRPGVWIDAPDIGLASEMNRLPPDDPLAAAVASAFSALGVTRPPPCRIAIHSSIPVASGMGSGAAVSVAVLRALSSFLGHPLNDEQVNQLTFEIEMLYHGTPSGIDNTVITYARPVYFVMGRPIETLRVATPFTVVIGDSGVASLTRDVVRDVRQAREAEPERFDRIFEAIGAVVRRARLAIESGDLQALGSLLDENHALLQQLTVSSPDLDRLVQAARSAGARGAKLSGGGRGGNMIALVGAESGQKISQALHLAGARQVITTEVK